MTQSVYQPELHHIFLILFMCEWKNLPLNIRNFQHFQYSKVIYNVTRNVPPKYFYYDDRKLETLLARLRTICRFLNYHFFLKNISLTPLCECKLIPTISLNAEILAHTDKCYFKVNFTLLLTQCTFLFGRYR
jgi:hypothetical protein